MNATGRLAVMPRDVAALEAAVDDMAVALLAGQHLPEAFGDGRRAGGAIGRAQVEGRQGAFEQPGQFGADAVAVEQQCAAVLGAQPLKLGGQGLVVRPPAGLAARGDLGGIRLGAVAVQGLAGEEMRGHQAGAAGRAGVEGPVVRRAVQVDDIAAVARHDEAGAQAIGQRPVQPLQMPVGVLAGQRARHQALAQFGRELGADMRQADQQRHTALLKAVDAHACPCCSCWRLPCQTRSFSGLCPKHAASSRGWAQSQMQKSARCPACSRPRSARPSARAPLTVRPRKASSGVRRNSTQAMLSISSGDSVGDVPGLWSVASASGTPASRSAAIGGSWVSRSA
mmetsp:Transcript_6416/g.26285  ORF Transcript_6416/g.26285 Transcript_6416/m.26285 type:complete len:340 (+) Transcript_6416:972-1991(+)